jgi:quercetin dioxygenase-like cupin family protein
MSLKLRLLHVGLILVFSTISLAGEPTETIHNKKVLVVTQTLSAGQRVSAPTDHPVVLVFLDGGSIEISSSDGQTKSQSVKRGDELFQWPRGAAIRNTASADLRTIRIEYLGKGGAEVWGTAGLAPNYKVLFEDSSWRIYDIKVAAGATEPQHTHHDRVVICLSGAEIEHTLPDGKKETTTLKADDIVWRLGATHVGHNIGTTDLSVIAIEPK